MNAEVLLTIQAETIASKSARKSRKFTVALTAEDLRLSNEQLANRIIEPIASFLRTSFGSGRSFTVREHADDGYVLSGFPNGSTFRLLHCCENRRWSIGAGANAHFDSFEEALERVMELGGY